MSARRFKPYPAYKDSGVEWLGEIPVHWEVKPLKRALHLSNADGSLIKGRMHQEPGEGLFPGFSASGQDIWVEEAQHHESGIVLSAVGARCGKTFKADGHWTAVANTHVIFPHTGFDRNFLWYLTNDETFWDRGGTAQPFVRVTSTLQRPWCFPSPNEQRAIAAFLDRETARIDALVAKKERLIELLQEQRTALITRAVTKGLDPTVPMKDSGVEWLGEIPAHWEVKRIKDATNKIGSGKTPSGGAEVYVSEGVMLLRSQNVQFGALRLDDVAYVDVATDGEMAGSRVREGDVLLNITGASLGRCCVARLEGKPANVNQHVCIIRPKPRVFEPSFLASALASRTGQAQIFTTENGISRDALNFDQIGRLVLACPPVEEQRAIAAFLDRETARIDALVAKVREAIERLKELRTALISAAVTGKIDVREEAAELDHAQITH